MNNKNLKLKHRSDLGAVFAETTISFLAFAALIFLTIDVIRLSLSSVSAEFVVNRAIRDASLDPTEDPLIKDDVVRARLTQLGQEFGVNLDESMMRVCSIGGGFTVPDPAACVRGDISTHSGGAPGELVFIEISYPFNFLWQGWGFNITSSALGRNEPEVTLP